MRIIFFIALLIFCCVYVIWKIYDIFYTQTQKKAILWIGGFGHRNAMLYREKDNTITLYFSILHTKYKVVGIKSIYGILPKNIFVDYIPANLSNQKNSFVEIEYNLGKKWKVEQTQKCLIAHNIF